MNLFNVFDNDGAKCLRIIGLTAVKILIKFAAEIRFIFHAVVTNKGRVVKKVLWNINVVNVLWSTNTS